jgi:hypothetical protein
MTPILMSYIDQCGYALEDTKSHASKYSKVTMSKLLGGVISIVSVTLLGIDYEIDRSGMKVERFF